MIFLFFPPSSTALHDEPASLELYSVLSVNFCLTFKLYEVRFYDKKRYGKPEGYFNHHRF